jgi:hypothetical protein
MLLDVERSQHHAGDELGGVVEILVGEFGPVQHQSHLRRRKCKLSSLLEQIPAERFAGKTPFTIANPVPHPTPCRCTLIDDPLRNRLMQFALTEYVVDIPHPSSWYGIHREGWFWEEPACFHPLA